MNKGTTLRPNVAGSRNMMSNETRRVSCNIKTKMLSFSNITPNQFLPVKLPFDVDTPRTKPTIRI